ncbi:MAG: DUF3574 domain-containing protein [Desulfobacteraceae bacterium]|nr:DUF3574 domain-containing protein [Desulfobacteraceae bacterium]
MNKKSLVVISMLIALVCFPLKGFAADVYSVRLFFGLSMPGGGAVSLCEWQSFLAQEIAKTFDGFNVVDSTGYYKGKPERSKIVTIVLDRDEMPKVIKLARSYATKFHQESVMMVKTPVASWQFIEAAPAPALAPQ